MLEMHQRSILPITGDTNFDRLVKAVSIRFLLCKASVFLVEINTYLWGDGLRLCKYPIFHHTFIY